MFLLLLSNIPLRSQDIPPPNPGLVLNIVSGSIIEFTFDEIVEYKDGILNGGQTYIRIGAIYDWKLQISANELTFIGTAGNTMELNNLGLTINSIGTNTEFNGHLVNNATVPVGVTYNPSSPYTLLTKGVMTNKGYGIENTFTLDWSMGIMQGTMNTTSLFDQMVQGTLLSDDYTVTVTLTLSVY
jgi:hypothetical protein